MPRMSSVVASRRAFGKSGSSNKSYAKAKPKGKTFSSKFRGVIRRGESTWQAQIQVDGNTMYLGRYKSEFEAATVYDEAAKKYHGAFAVLNYDDSETEAPSSPSYNDSSSENDLPVTRETSPWKDASATKRHAQHKLAMAQRKGKRQPGAKGKKRKSPLSQSHSAKKRKCSSDSESESESESSSSDSEEDDDESEEEEDAAAAAADKAETPKAQQKRKPDGSAIATAAAGRIGDWAHSEPTMKQHRDLHAILSGGNLGDMALARDALAAKRAEMEELIKLLEAGGAAKVPEKVMEHVKSSCHRVEVHGGEKEEAKDFPPECPGHHACDFKLVEDSKAYPGGEWICDDCDKNFVLGQRWACSECEYDMCTECGKKASEWQHQDRMKKRANGKMFPASTKLVQKEPAFDVSAVFPSSMGTLVVGKVVEIKWPENGEWYAGRVTAYDKETGKHTVEYYNSEIEHVTLNGDCENGIVWRAKAPTKKTRARRH